jgi:hypothetical protein
MSYPNNQLTLTELKLLRNIVMDIDCPPGQKIIQALPDNERLLVFKLNRLIQRMERRLNLNYVSSRRQVSSTPAGFPVK